MLIIYVVAFIAIFYFMAIRPQQKQRKAHQALLASLKKGDQVVTASGIYGTVKRVDENIVTVEIARGVSIKLARQAVTQIVQSGAAPEPRRNPEPAELEEETGIEMAEVEEIVEDVTVDEVESTTKSARGRGGRLSKPKN